MYFDLHIDFAIFIGMDWAATDWKPLLSRFPAVMVATSGEHSKGMLETTFPWALAGTQPKMPLEII